MKIGLIKYIRCFFRKKALLRDFFIKDNFYFHLSEGGYPVFISLEGKGIYAFHSIFACSKEELAKVKRNISHVFSVDENSLEEEGVVSEGIALVQPYYSDALAMREKYVLIYSFRCRMDNNLISVVTNSPVFISAMCELNIKQPLPWVVFPNLEPDTFGSLQGEVDFWWGNIWRPFWDSLSIEEKRKFLARHNVSQKWRDFILRH